MRRIALPLLLICWYAPWALGETVRYVSDNLEVTLHSGKTPKHSILKMLPSGVQVTVIQADADGYSKVRTKDGAEGWVLTRFLSSAPSARDRLAEAEQRLAAIKIENNPPWDFAGTGSGAFTRSGGTFATHPAGRTCPTRTHLATEGTPAPLTMNSR